MRWRSKSGLARSAPLLGIGFKLLLERRQLGERRVGIGRLVTSVAGVAAALDVLGPQLRIAVGTVAALAPVRPIAAWRTLAAGAVATLEAVEACALVGPLVAARVAVAPLRPLLLVLGARLRFGAHGAGFGRLAGRSSS